MKGKQIISYILMMTAAISYEQTLAQDALTTELFSESFHFELSGDYKRAVQPLLRGKPDHSYEMNMRLGWLYYLDGRHKEAVSYYDKAILLKPKSIEARLGYVLPASMLGNWENIITQYTEIIRQDDANYIARFRLGMIWYNRKEYGQALDHFGKLLLYYAMDYDVLMMCAWCRLTLAQKKAAAELFYKALNVRPGDFWANEGLKKANS